MIIIIFLVIIIVPISPLIAQAPGGNSGIDTILVWVILIGLVFLVRYFIKSKSSDKEITNSVNYEYKRECNRCNTVWYSSKSEENILEKQEKGYKYLAIGGLEAGAQVKRMNQAAGEALRNMKKCPKCLSIDYTETIEEIKRKL